MADGNAAIWAAARTVWPEAGEQRCWNHKMRNVLDRLPQREQSEAKELLRTVVYASTRAEALKARQAFGKRDILSHEATFLSLGCHDLPPKAVPPRVLVQAPPFGWGVVQEAEVG